MRPGTSSLALLGENCFFYDNDDDNQPTGGAACLVPLPPSLKKKKQCMLTACYAKKKEDLGLPATGTTHTRSSLKKCRILGSSGWELSSPMTETS